MAPEPDTKQHSEEGRAWGGEGSKVDLEAQFPVPALLMLFVMLDTSLNLLRASVSPCVQ